MATEICGGKTTLRHKLYMKDGHCHTVYIVPFKENKQKALIVKTQGWNDWNCRMLHAQFIMISLSQVVSKWANPTLCYSPSLKQTQINFTVYSVKLEISDKVNRKVFTKVNSKGAEGCFYIDLYTTWGLADTLWLLECPSSKRGHGQNIA